MIFLRSSRKSTLPDDRIISDFRKTGDSEYLGILFERYAHLVFAVGMKYLHNEEDAKDTVIAVFENLPVNLTKYEIRNLGNWIHSVTKNYCLRQLKKQKEIPNEKAIFGFAAEDVVSNDEDMILVHIDHLEEALQSLNQKQRQCVELFYTEEKSYQEISLLMDLTYNEVKSHIQNGKRNLRKYLEKKQNESR